MVVYFFTIKKTIILTAVVCGTLLYTGIVNPKKYGYTRIPVNKLEITTLKGSVISNPRKVLDSYTFNMNQSFLFTNKKIGYFSKNISKIFIPDYLVESYMPGKLYTDFNSKKNKGVETPLIIEKGTEIIITGKYSKNNDFFYASAGYSLGWKNSITGQIQHYRALCRLQFKKLMYAWGNAGGFILALLSGSQEYTENILATALKNAGLSYILALSGMHLSLFSGMSIFFSNKIIGKKYAYLIGYLSTIFFIWFAGLSPSLLRAFILNTFLTIKILIGIPNIDMLSVLSASFLLQIIISPSDIFQYAFILSYAALAGIYLISPYLQRSSSRFLPTFISNNFSITVSAQFFTTPVTMKLFGTIIPGTVFAAIVMSPIITMFLYSSIILITFSFLFPEFSTISGQFLGFIYNIIKLLVIRFAYLPVVRV